MRRLFDLLARIALCVAYRVQLIVWGVFRPRRPSAHVALWWRGRILLVRCSYRPGLSLPAGCMKRGERPASAAARELAEETGIEVAAGELRLVSTIVSDEEHKLDEAHIFAVHRSERPTVEVDNREVVWAEFLEPGAALRERLSRPARRYLEEWSATREGNGEAARPDPPERRGAQQG